MLLLVGVPLIAAADSRWARVDAPAAGQPQAVGGYAAGCLAGAEPLPPSGHGYRAMRTHRNRHYGHPSLIAFLRRLAARADARGLGTLLIGDLAQPRGGPMGSGHRSHQTGLDADLWFRLLPPGRVPGPSDAGGPRMHYMVVGRGERLNTEHWSWRQRDLLHLTASDPAVQRIFVNPVIKHALCRSETERAWLAKLRPWWGHAAHFHVRLRCPAGSSRCKPQHAVPAGDGCDHTLDWWLAELRRPPEPAKPAKPRPAPELPRACAAVLAGEVQRGIELAEAD